MMRLTGIKKQISKSFLKNRFYPVLFLYPKLIQKQTQKGEQHNNMKKKIIAALMSSAVMLMGFSHNPINTEAMNSVAASVFHDDDTIITPTERGIYAKSMMVCDIDLHNSIITVVDAQGYEFEFSDDCPEDYMINDLVACTMDNMGTTTILDDALINAYYSGNITDFQEVTR